MYLKVVGINHKTAPIEVREKFFLSAIHQDLLLSELKSHPQVCEAFVLSTCNRTEVYMHLLEGADTAFLVDIIANIKEIRKITSFQKYLYVYSNQEAVDHLFRVASGLDSLALGERQILGQVKDSFKRAQEKAMFGKSFNILSNAAIRTGKKAQTETAISHGGSSVSWAAVIMAERILGSLQGMTILIIGAGKMSALTATQLPSKRAKKIYIMNRTQENSQKLAQRFQAEAVAFYDIKEILSNSDVCFCASDAPHYILDKDTVEAAMRLRGNKPLTLIDISMPRNIDPAVSSIKDISLFMIDDLDNIVKDNLLKRQMAVKKVEQIIDRKVTEFYQKLKKKNRPEERLVPKPVP
ncbi:MAG: glutamyl-tRNA reductase [Omnitrophica WOR_2 bacterium GWA2_47_8]|nr:MAG: glutamyl-tRNA reductase [Omnitrophica WOR_2 bacterium GWA2_47_8]